MSWTRFHWLESCVRGLRSGKTCRFLFCVTAGLSSVGTVDGYVFISHVRRVARLHFSCFRLNCLSDVDYRRRKRARSPPTRSAISTVRVRSPLMASSRPPEFLREYDTSTFFFLTRSFFSLLTVDAEENGSPQFLSTLKHPYLDCPERAEQILMRHAQ